MSSAEKPKAIFGGPLDGDARVRYIFMDEAGISAREPVSIVVGLIVHADKECLPVEKRLMEIMTTAPQKLWGKVILPHAKKIWGDSQYRDDWDLKDRKRFLMDIMSIPRQMNLALAFGAVSREMDIPEQVIDGKLSLDQWHHGLAFQRCIIAADQWIVRAAKPRELATVIAEDVPESKKFLRFIARHTQITDKQISRIRMPIHFVDKIEEPLLAIADACAFGLRRYLSNQSHGEDFMAAIGESARLPILTKENPFVSSVFGLTPGTSSVKINYRFGPWRGKS